MCGQVYKEQDHPPSLAMLVPCSIDKATLGLVQSYEHISNTRKLLTGELAVPKKNLDGPAYLARSEAPFHVFLAINSRVMQNA